MGQAGITTLQITEVFQKIILNIVIQLLESFSHKTKVD